jgi:hypothetical protein
MARMNGTGPEGRGPRTGRGLGKCKKISEDEALNKLGKGMGKRFKAGGGEGKGKRFQSGLNK